MKVFNKKRKGSITIEAAIVLPVVIMTLLFIANILNICMVNLCMQHALNNTARKISQNTYMIYRIAGEKDYKEFIETIGSVGIDGYRNVEQNFNTTSEHAGNIMNNITATFVAVVDIVEKLIDFTNIENLKKIPDSLRSVVQGLNGVYSSTRLFKESLGSLVESGKENIQSVVVKQLIDDIYAEGRSSVSSINALSLVQYVFETYKTELAIPASRIKDLNVFNSKLDPAGYFTLVASYEYDNPFSFMSSESGKGGLLNRKIKMVNTVTIKPFLGSNGTTFVKDSDEKVPAPTVYVPSDTSEYKRDKIRYHKQGCENLSGASMPVALSNAQKTYAGPCEACMPDPDYKDNLKLDNKSEESGSSDGSSSEDGGADATGDGHAGGSR